MSAAEATFDKKEIIKWLITIAVTALTYFAGTQSGGLDTPQTTFLAYTMFIILITAFSLLPDLLIAIMLPCGYLLLGLAPANVIFASWGNSTIWMVLAAFLAANVLNRIGLLKRLVYWVIMHLGTSYRMLVIAFGIAGAALAILTPSVGAIAILLGTIAFTLIEQCDLKGTKTAIGLVMAVALSLQPAFMYIPATTGMLVSAANTATSGIYMDYVVFFAHNWPLVIMYFLMLLLVPVLFKQDAVIDADIVRSQASELGPVSSDEKKGIILAILFIILVLTPSIHHLDLMYCFILFALAMYLPGINLGTMTDIKTVNFSMLFFIASFIAIGSVAAALGFNKVVSGLLAPILASLSSGVAVNGIVYVFAFVVNFLMTPLAAIGALTAPITQITLDLGLGTYPVLYSFYGGLQEALLPYEVAPYLIMYGFGVFKFGDFAKAFGARAVLHLLFVVAILVPYWSLIGLM